MKWRISLLLLALSLLYPIEPKADIMLYSDEEKNLPEIDEETFETPEMGMEIDYAVCPYFFWQDTVGGISENLICDMDAGVFVTKAFRIYISNSWKQGITYYYSEDQIIFYCMAVNNSESSQEETTDGLLCRIFRSEVHENPVSDYYIGSDEEYDYYCQSYSNRAEPDDEDNYELYQAMCADMDEVIGSLVIMKP